MQEQQNMIQNQLRQSVAPLQNWIQSLNETQVNNCQYKFQSILWKLPVLLIYAVQFSSKWPCIAKEII